MKWWIVIGGALALAFGGAGIVALVREPGGDDADAPDGGFLAVEPQRLADNARQPLDRYTLGRIVRSEADSHSSEAERIAIAWVAVNQARVFGQDVTAAATRGSKGRGYYGAQNAGGRWISTRFAPGTADFALARSVLAKEVRDPTGGATKFIHVATEDALHAREPAKYKTAQEVLNGWLASGYVLRAIPGVSPSRFVTLAPASAGAVA